MISFQEFKEDMIPCTFPLMNREAYYKKHMDKGITIEDAYEQYRKTFE